MDKNKIVKLGVASFVAAVGYSAYSTFKKIREMKEQEIIDITPNEEVLETPQK